MPSYWKHTNREWTKAFRLCPKCQTVAKDRRECPKCFTPTERIKGKNRLGSVAIRQNYAGIHYDSKKEAIYAQDLDLMLKAGEIKAWERQVKIGLNVHDHHIADYRVDFMITHKDDSIEFVEVKGLETREWQMKWKLFEALAPGMFPGAKLTVER